MSEPFVRYFYDAMQVESPVLCEPLPDATVLALYTTTTRNALQQKVPYTRSVYVMREAESLVLVQGLRFVLYVASNGLLGADELVHLMQQAYGFKYYSRKAREQAEQEREATEKLLSESGLYDEAQWADAADDAARRELFQKLFAETETDPEARFQELLRLWRHLQAMDELDPLREANSQLFTDYLKLKDPVEQRVTLDADAFFVVRGVRELPIMRTWPCASRLAGQQVWQLEFDCHAALEFFVHKFRWPLVVGGQWDCQQKRFIGRDVPMTVLEPVDWAAPPEKLQLRIYQSEKGSGSHEYALAQTQALGDGRTGRRLCWQFERPKQRATHGLLHPALYQSGAARDTVHDFASLCASARHNKQRVASSRATVPLERLGEALLLDFAARHELKLRRETVAAPLVDYTHALTRQLMPKAPQQQARRRVDLKRRRDDVEPVKSGTATKKKRHEVGGGGSAPLRQATLWAFAMAEK